MDNRAPSPRKLAPPRRARARRALGTRHGRESVHQFFPTAKSALSSEASFLCEGGRLAPGGSQLQGRLPAVWDPHGTRALGLASEPGTPLPESDGAGLSQARARPGARPQAAGPFSADVARASAPTVQGVAPAEPPWHTSPCRQGPHCEPCHHRKVRLLSEQNGFRRTCEHGHK